VGFTFQACSLVGLAFVGSHAEAAVVLVIGAAAFGGEFQNEADNRRSIII
jgi:hypothetical protein